MNGFENVNEELPSKEKFHSSFTDKKKLMIKSMSKLLRFGIDLK